MHIVRFKNSLEIKIVYDPFTAMPQTPRRFQTCPVCRKGYTSIGRLENHIELLHPSHGSKTAVDAEVDPDNNNYSSRFDENTLQWDNAQATLDLNNTDLWANRQTDVAHGINDGNVVDPRIPIHSETIKDAGSAIPWADLGTQSAEDPFNGSEKAYRWARWIVKNNISRSAIKELFDDDIMIDDDEMKMIFKSSYGLRQVVQEMTEGLGRHSWTKVDTNLQWEDSDECNPISFYSRDPVEVGLWLLQQPCYAEYLHFSPQKTFTEGDRLYEELHSSDWWWQEQVSNMYNHITLYWILSFMDLKRTIPDNGTIMPLIFFSDVDQLFWG